MNKGLNIDQVLHIPLSSANFSQSVNEGAAVYYKTGDNETLARMSGKLNNVPVDKIKYWNPGIPGNPESGKKVIIGFLVNTEGLQQTAIHHEDKTDPDITTIVEPPVQKPVVEEKKTEVKTETPVKVDPPVVKETVKPEKKNVTPSDEGYFKSSYEQQLKSSPASKSETVTSGIFKTNSGWNDGKFYVLIDGVSTGTIVRITNPDNNKSVYAKVLGEMSGIRQNEGLNIRMSNAAASNLQITEQDKFVVKISY